MKAPPASALAVAALAVVVAALSGCTAGPSAAGAAFVSKTPGVLTVATSFPHAPGFWSGLNTTSGFESELAAKLGDKLGFDRVRVVQVPFADVTHGRLDGADIGISQVSPTSERAETADFSTPYLTAPPGVLARRNVEARDMQDLQGLQWVVARVSSLTPIVLQTVRPVKPPIVVEDRTHALQVLAAGRADALLLDLPVALGLARSSADRLHVVGQLRGGEELAVVLPKGSPNRDIVDSSIRALIANGTVDDLDTKWLGDNGDHVPLILSEQR